jgi:hydroxyacyl-ACP dehydratase HTD2-like protein with hotdog domain
LSFTLLVTNLRIWMAREGIEEEIESVEYRNLAPLYAGERMRLCGRKKEDGKWEIWAETPEGGVAIRGVVKTRSAEERKYGDLKMILGS